jgi:hypothetical protein
MNKNIEITNFFHFYFSCTKCLLQEQQQQQQQQPKEKDEEETKCRFVVVRRINLPPSLSSLAYLSLGSDSRDGVLVYF